MIALDIAISGDYNEYADVNEGDVVNSLDVLTILQAAASAITISLKRSFGTVKQQYPQNPGTLLIFFIVITPRVRFELTRRRAPLVFKTSAVVRLAISAA